MEYTLFLRDLIWSLAPIAWGASTWFMAFGPGKMLFALFRFDYQLNLLFRFLVISGVVLFYFGSLFKQRQKDRLVLGKIEMWLPSVPMILACVLFGIVVSFFFNPLWHYPFINSLILGTLISSVVEELVTHSIFVQYNISLATFVLFNSISSISFALMHNGYVPEWSLYLFSFTHHIENFIFSFVLGILAYRSKRIELAILIHVCSNAFYTIFIIGLGLTLPHYFYHLKLLFILLLSTMLKTKRDLGISKL